MATRMCKSLVHKDPSLEEHAEMYQSHAIGMLDTYTYLDAAERLTMVSTNTSRVKERPEMVEHVMNWKNSILDQVCLATALATS